MSRLIQRFTGEEIGHLSGVPSIEIMSDDFNNAETYSFSLSALGRDGFSREEAIYHVEVKCSENNPGVELSIRDQNCSMTFDEHEVARNIVKDLRPNHTGGLWGAAYMQTLVNQIISRFATEKSRANKKLYKHAVYGRGGVIRSGGVPITIFRNIIDSNDNVIALSDLVGMRRFDNNIKEPTIEIYTEDGIFRLTGTDIETVLSGEILHISQADVAFDTAVSMIPSEVIEDEQAAKEYLAAHQFVREEDTFADIDLF